MHKIPFRAVRALAPVALAILLCALISNPACSKEGHTGTPSASGVAVPTFVIFPGDTPYTKSSQPNVWVRTMDPKSKEGLAFRKALPGAPGIPIGPVYTEMKSGTCVAGRPRVPGLSNKAGAPRPAHMTVRKGGHQ